jgi:hypothetical protein
MLNIDECSERAAVEKLRRGGGWWRREGRCGGRRKRTVLMARVYGV